MTLGLTLKIKESEDKIAKMILNEIKKQLQPAINSMIPGITKKVKDLIATKIKSSPEYTSMLSGKLQAHIGVAAPEPILENIITTIQNSTQITVSKLRIRSDEIVGGLKIEILKSDFSDVLKVPGVAYYSNEFLIEWLQWLLFEGDSVIVADYRIQLGNYSKASKYRVSRTGKAIMVSKEGTLYRVPPEFSGTPRNNFLTRSLENIEPDLENIFISELEHHL